LTAAFSEVDNVHCCMQFLKFKVELFFLAFCDVAGLERKY